MTIDEIETGMIVNDRLGTAWEVKAVCKTNCTHPHILVDAVDPHIFDGAVSVSATFRERALQGFQPGE